MSRLRRISDSISVAGTLRWTGGSILALALASFLMTGVEVQNDLHRFLLLLLQTGLFAGGAFALQRLLKDDRGARLLLGVALMSVAAGFAVLGALIYGWQPVHSLHWLDAEGLIRSDTHYPGFARWQATSSTDLLIALLVATVILLPTNWFALAVMARKAVLWLAPGYLALCSLLLVPVRDPALIVAMLICGVTIALVLLTLKARNQLELTTFEGRFAQLSLFVPLLILAVRSVVMYPADELLILGLSIALFVILRWTITSFDKKSRLQYLLYPIAALTACTLAVYAASFFSSSDMVAFTVTTITGALLLRMLRSGIDSTRLTLAVEGLAAILMLIGWQLSVTLAFPLTLTNSVLEMIMHVATPLIILTLAVLDRRIILGLIALAAIGHESWWVLQELTTHFLEHGWQVLLAAGLASVIAAALIDRHGFGWLRRKNALTIVD